MLAGILKKQMLQDQAKKAKEEQTKNAWNTKGKATVIPFNLNRNRKNAPTASRNKLRETNPEFYSLNMVSHFNQKTTQKCPHGKFYFCANCNKSYSRTNRK